MKSSLTKSIRKSFQVKELDENEKIVEYLVNEKTSVKLTEKEKEKMKRYFFAHDLISQKRSRHEVARKLQVKYKISRAQAYRDIFHMQYVIGSSLSIDENYYEKFLIDSIIETIRLARNKTDLKAKAAAERNLAMVLGFPKTDDNRITPDMLQQNILIITSDIAALGLPKIDNLEDKIQKFKRAAKKKPQIDIQEAEEV